MGRGPGRTQKKSRRNKGPSAASIPKGDALKAAFSQTCPVGKGMIDPALMNRDGLCYINVEYI